MLSPERMAVLTDIFDTLLELYELRRHATDKGDWDRVSILRRVIARTEARRDEVMYVWKNDRETAINGAATMADIKSQQRRHVREKTVIDHVARDLFEPKQAPETKEQPGLSPTTSTGLPVEEQVRKEWDPRKG